MDDARPAPRGQRSDRRRPPLRRRRPWLHARHSRRRGALRTDHHYTALLRRKFDAVTPENALEMGPLRPEPGAFAFSDADAIVVITDGDAIVVITDADATVAFAAANGATVRGHVLGSTTPA